MLKTKQIVITQFRFVRTDLTSVLWSWRTSIIFLSFFELMQSIFDSGCHLQQQSKQNELLCTRIGEQVRLQRIRRRSYIHTLSAWVTLSEIKNIAFQSHNVLEHFRDECKYRFFPLIILLDAFDVENFKQLLYYNVFDSVGDSLGDSVGLWVGCCVGFLVGCLVGCWLGCIVGCSMGCSVGSSEGFGVGLTVGAWLGCWVGCKLGCSDGWSVGFCDGCCVGWTVGCCVGSFVSLPGVLQQIWHQ